MKLAIFASVVIIAGNSLAQEIVTIPTNQIVVKSVETGYYWGSLGAEKKLLLFGSNGFKIGKIFCGYPDFYAEYFLKSYEYDGANFKFDSLSKCREVYDSLVKATMDRGHLVKISLDPTARKILRVEEQDSQ